MSEERLLDPGSRRQIIEEIKGQENVERCSESLKDVEVYDGKIRPYVTEELYKSYGSNYVNYPIKSSINVVKKVVDSKSSLYREPPVRDYSELSDDQLEVVEKLYLDMGIDQGMMNADKMYELQKQTHLYCIPKNGKLRLKTITNHNLNVIPREDDPETAEIYIFSAFDKKTSDRRAMVGDGVNQKIGDYDDYDASTERYYVWSSSYHFVMDGTGVILTESIDNPIAPLVPFVEITSAKDFEYWTRKTSEAANFTVDYNVSLSDQAQIVRMQGFAQAYLKAPEDLQPTTLMTGPAHLIRLVTNPDQSDKDVEFGFAQPGADLGGVQEYIISMLSQFLSTQGIDANAISASNSSTQKYASGTERLLAMIEKFEASKDTMALFETAEKELYQIIVAWLNVLSNTDMLDDEYKTSEIKDSNLSVIFNRPEGTISEMEKLDIIQKKIDLGLITKVDAIMDIENKTFEEATERAEQITEEKSVSIPFTIKEDNDGTDDIEDENISDN